MPVANKFIRGLEGNMRLRVNNKPIPDYGRSFRNPVPPPKPGGGGIITKIIKFGGKLLATPLLVLLDFFGNQKGFSDGTLPDWVKDVGEKSIAQAAKYPFTGGQALGVSYNISISVTQKSTFSGIKREAGAFWGTIPGPILAVDFTPKYSENSINSNTPANKAYIQHRKTDGTTGTIFNNDNQNTWVITNITAITITRSDGQSDTSGNPPPIQDTITSESGYNAKNNFDRYTPEEWKSKFLADFWGEQDRLNKQSKISTIPEPKISLKPAVLPTEIPQPIPDYDPDQEPDLYIFPDPEPVFVPTPRPKIIPEPIINPDPQPDVNPAPDPTPKPEPKWTKITKYIPEPKEPIVIITKPPIVLDKTPKPLPDPQPVKPPPPTQTPIDKCVDHCGSGTIDFNLPDDSELAELLKAIKKKVDEIEQSVNQTLEGEIEVGSCEIPKDISNQTDELVYTPDPAKKITYSDKGLRAINLALSGVQTKLTSLHQEFCQQELPIAAIPEWWQLRPESHRPQLIVQFGEVRADGSIGKAMYPLTIPHFSGSKESAKKIDFKWRKGSVEGILTLKDNSKLIVNAVSKEEAAKIIGLASRYINTAQLANSFSKIGERKGQPFKQITVAPKVARYFADGAKSTNPTWVVRLDKKD